MAFSFYCGPRGDSIMRLMSWLRTLRSQASHRRVAPSWPPDRYRPKLEALEDRTVPSTFNVTTPLDVVDPGDGVLSFREAVLAANASPKADTINLPAGTYTLALAGAGEDHAATGDLDIKGDLTISGAGAEQTTIDAAGL